MYLVLRIKHKGCTARIVAPMTGTTLILASFLFVDNIDLVVISKPDEDEIGVCNKL